MRLIDADALIAEIKMDIEDDGLQEKMVFYRINKAPTIDIPHTDDWEEYSERLWKTAYERGKADRPRGEWICKGDWAECSLCGADSGTIMDGLERVPRYTRFCPECGCRMKGADDEDSV